MIVYSILDEFDPTLSGLHFSGLQLLGINEMRRLYANCESYLVPRCY